jgi:hypothetical protein
MRSRDLGVGNADLPDFRHLSDIGSGVLARAVLSFKQCILLINQQDIDCSWNEAREYPSPGTETAVISPGTIITEAVMVIYMDQYRKAHTINMAHAHRHVAEKLCVNGYAAPGVIAMPCEQASSDLSPQLPEDFSHVDMAAFYNRISALASHI